MGRPPETCAVDELTQKQRIFIKRERIRRAMIATKPGETICLQETEIAILLKWIRELEMRCKEWEQGTSKGK
jgi:hypothetical protein